MLLSLRGLSTLLVQAAAFQGFLPDRFVEFRAVTWQDHLVYGPGDVNRDGYDDTVSLKNPSCPSSWWRCLPGQAFAHVRSGLDASVLHTYQPSDPAHTHFVMLSGPVLMPYQPRPIDLDADGYPDLLLHHQLVTSAATFGAVDVWSGSNGSLLGSAIPPPPATIFAPFIASPGDVDGDGFKDVLVLGGHWWGADHLYVYRGSGLQFFYTIMGPPSPAGFPITFDGVGDVDMDGFDDFFVSVPAAYAPPGSPHAWSPVGWLGLYSGYTGSLIAEEWGSHIAQHLGKDAVFLGDTNGNGIPEIAHLERRDSREELRVVEVPSFQTVYRVRVGGAGHLRRTEDIDLDGIPDLIFAGIAPSWLPSAFGVVAASGASGAILGGVEGLTYPLGLGDVNGDGLGDFAAIQFAGYVYSAIRIDYPTIIYVARNLERTGPPPTPGGQVDFAVAAPKRAGRPFRIVLSQGTMPIFHVGPFAIPVAPDNLFFSTLAAGIGGTLDTAGVGGVSIPIPPNPGLQGLTLHASGVVLDPAGPLGIGCVLTRKDFTIQ